MLIETSKSRMFFMTEIALVRSAIPRLCSGTISRVRVRVTVGTSEEARRIGDDIILVVLADEAVDGNAVDARGTFA